MKHEHFGIAVVELMASGMITVAHNSAGPRLDIIGGSPKEVGFLAESPDEFANQVYKSLTKFDDYKDLVGFPIDYKISELIKTKHTYSHRVFMNEEEHIIARIVLKENPPFISKKEMDGLDGTHYNRYTGYPVIM